MKQTQQWHAGGLLAATWVCLAVTARAEGPATVEIPLCREAPVLDGALGDPAWAAALEISDFALLGERAAPAGGGPVTARVMRDAEWLYVGFDIRHPNPDSIVPRTSQHDGKVQLENCVKVAFDPGTHGRQWYHFRLSAGNVRSEQRNSAAKGSEPDWTIPWRSATRRTETGWQAELALPFALLLGVGDPARARLNLLAYLYVPVRDPQAVVVGEERRAYSWARLPPAWWTAPESFVALRGLDQAEFKGAFLPMLEGVSVGAYRMAGSRTAYPVSGRVRNLSSRDGTVSVRARDLPTTGDAIETSATVSVTGAADADWTLEVPVASVLRRSVRVALVAASGEELDAVRIASPPVLDLFSAYLDRNYYTTEQTAGVCCRLGLPAEGLKGTRLAVRLESGAILGETRAVAPETVWSVPLAALPEGRHPVRLEWRRADGALMADQAALLVKRAPQPGREWKVDRQRRIVLDNGAPFLAYGVVFSGWSGADREADYREIAEAGFNCILAWGGARTLEDWRRGLDTAQRHGLRVAIPAADLAESPDFKPVLPEGIARWGGFTTLKGQVFVPRFPRAEKSRIYAELFGQAAPLIRARIEALRDHPALMSWESFDEPAEAHEFDQYVQGRDLYALIQEADGYHPVRGLWNADRPSLAEARYLDWYDIFGRDPYWAPPVMSLDASPHKVGRRTLDMWAMTDAAAWRHPLWITPVLELYSGHRKRDHRPAEQRAQTYLGLIYRASGLLYFVYPVAHQATWDGMRALGAELRALNPYLTAPVPDHRVLYDGLDAARCQAAGTWPDVHVGLRRNTGGDYALLMVNGWPWPVRAEVRFEGLAPRGPLRPALSGKAIPVSDGRVGETLEPFATRAYLFAADPATGAVTVAVSQTALKDGYVPETALPTSGRPGRKNLMLNPSFEEAALAGWPDYWAFYVPGLKPDQRIGREHAVAGLDPDRPWHGAVSLRLSGTVWPRITLAPQHDRPTPYVWSAWMRADRDGFQVRWLGLDGVNLRERFFTLTPEWKRYDWPLTVPASVTQYAMYSIEAWGPSKQDGRFWVDAMQFEQGTAPTAFEP